MLQDSATNIYSGLFYCSIYFYCKLHMQTTKQGEFASKFHSQQSYS